MRINVFEGARRIAKLMALVAVFVYVGYAYMSSPYVPVHYLVKWPGDVPMRVERCTPDSVTEYRGSVSLKNGKEVSLDLCFEKQTSNNGQKVVFYKFDTATGKYWGNESYNTEVVKYIEAVTQSFVIPLEDEESIEARWWSKRWHGIWEATLYLIGWLAFLWAFTWTVGWIVRGFMDIPKGRDRRIPAA
jgi:hypothetical protein